MSESFEINPDDLEPAIDLELSVQKKVLRLAARLDEGDYYRLLDVPYDATKADIKKAYFALMSDFHADKYYGRNLGSFEGRMRTIVQVLTKASDTLSRKKTRAEYDEYLASRRGTLGARASVSPAPDSPVLGKTSPRDAAPAPESVRIPAAPKAPEIEGVELSHDSPRPAQDDEEFATRPTDRAPARDSAVPGPSPGRSAAQTVAARRLLARKMGRRPSSPPLGGPAKPDQRREAVRADLKARYEARTGDVEQKVEMLLAKSEEAQAAGDWSGAVSAVRLAQKLKADDASLEVRLAHVQAEADRVMAPRFLEQAKYEEKQRQFERAARSYERAARGKDAADLFDKAAGCLLRLHQLDAAQLRGAVELAREAVKRDNRKVDYRLTLARAYDGSGMKTSALGEIRRALELEPSNQDAKNLYRKLK